MPNKTCRLLAMVFSSVLLFAAPTSYAQQSDASILTEIKDILNNMGTLLNNTVEQSITLVTNMAFTANPNLADTMLANLQYNQIAVPTASQQNKNYLAQTISLYLNPVSMTGSDYRAMYSNMPKNEGEVSQKLPQYLFSTILNTTGFTENSPTATYAQNFINAIIDLDNTPKNLKYTAFNDLTNPQANYLTALSSFIAAQSVAINSLYDIFTKRLVIPNLGTQVGMIRLYPLDANDTGTFGSPIADASPLQVDEYLASRRVMNPKWYANMEAAPPATVQREMLYVLAELRQEMFKQRIELEKLTANVAAFQLQDAQSENRQKFLVKPPT